MLYFILIIFVIVFMVCGKFSLVSDNKMFAVVEFAEKDGGGLSLVNSSWLTPRKKEVFWPPTKDSTQFNKIIRATDQNTETWSSYQISKIFYECDDYEKARKKLKQAEETSDLNTDIECDIRRRIKPKRILESSSEEEISKFERPPKLNFCKKSDKVHTVEINQSQPNEIDEAHTSRQSNSFTPIASRPFVTTPTRTPTICTGSDQKVLPKILEKLVKIEVQNEQILSLLQNENKNLLTPKICTSLPTLPVNIPVHSIENLQRFEAYLSEENQFNLMTSYLASLGGTSITSRTNRILRQLLVDQVAKLYSFFGRKKLNFHSLHLAKLIISSVKVAIPQSTEKEIEDVIKIWLKHAAERLKKKQTD